MNGEMKNRTQRAKEEYQKRFADRAGGHFYPTDIVDILESSGGNRISAITDALEAGFMIGYRKGSRDTRKKITGKN